MRRGTLGGGEWVGVGYMVMVLGALISGFSGADQWFEIILAFAVAVVAALGIAHGFAVWGVHHRVPGEQGRDER